MCIIKKVNDIAQTFVFDEANPPGSS